MSQTIKSNAIGDGTYIYTHNVQKKWKKDYPPIHFEYIFRFNCVNIYS